MKNKVKKLLKNIVIVWVVICTLLPTLFSGFVFAADDGYLNTERAGNFAANFAINFYDNWSSKNETKDNQSSEGFIWPLDNFKIKSSFGPRSMNYGPEYHKGIDLAATVGTPIKASADGKVVDLYRNCTHFNNLGDTCGGGYGNNVKIDTGDCLNVYAHMSRVETTLSVGDEVRQGQVIGYVGSSGSSEGPHCHFEIVSNNIDGLTQLQYIARGELHGYKYSVDPSIYVEGSSGGTGTGTGYYGVVKTEYDSATGPYSIVPEDASSYKLNNNSWINFVYYQALFKDSYRDDLNKVFTGTGTSLRVNPANFDDKNNIPGVKDVANDSPILDISTLISEGKVLPGDILYVDKGDGTKEYLFYVGGTKVIYATDDESVNPSGALKYEYLEYYLRRIRRKLREGHEDDENFEMPKYGVAQIYRLKKDVAESIEEKDANLFFNGKGYYSKVTYEGIPVDVQLYETKVGFFKWLFSLFKMLCEFLLNLIIYIFRMQVIGWANLFENLLQHVLLGITGDNNSSGWDAIFGTSATSASGERITVESIFFNKIPILDANFFNFESAGGHSLVTETELIGPIRPGESRTVFIPDSDNVAYRLRKNLNLIYTVIRNASIAILLFVLIAVGIRIALTSIAEKKAEFKKFFVSWVYAISVVILMHFFMYAVFAVNDTFVGICEDWNHKAAKESVSEILVSTNSDEELSLYDAVRVKAYAFNWKEGLPATIVYVFLIYLLIRFSFIYFKRYLTIYILALTSSFMGVKYAIDRLLGKKTNSLNKWFKDFAFNVLLQTVHALIYSLFMAVAISVSEKSVGGALIALVILNFMLQADKLVIKIFGLDKAGSLAGVNQPEKFSDVFRKFLPIWTISRGMYKLGKNSIMGDQGFFRRKIDFVFAHNAESAKDANKIWENRKYNLIGGAANIVDKPFEFLRNRKHVGAAFQAIDKHLPIRHLKMLSADLSTDTKKQYYKDIKGYLKQETKRFTRNLGTVKDFTLGTAGTIASLGMMVANPLSGAGMLIASRGTISKHKSLNRTQMKMDRYKGTKRKAKEIRNNSRDDYKAALNGYVAREMGYQEEYNRLLDDYANSTPGSADRQNIEDKIRELRKARRKERAKDLHRLQEADENLAEAKIEYGNAKHERNARTIMGKPVEKGSRFVEKISGLKGKENMAMSESRASFDTRDSAKKMAKKLDDMEKAAKIEVELRKLTADFKNEIKNIEVDGKKISEEEANKLFEDYMAQTVKEASNLSVKASYITNAINEYLHEKKSDKIEPKDIDSVIDKVQEGLNRSGKKTRISDDAKEMIKNEMEKQMINEGKGLGFEDKVASEIIRKVLGKQGAMDNTKKSKVNASVAAKQKELLNKLVQIHTYNDVGTIKHKSSLVSITKVIKDAKKKKVGGK